MFGFGGEDFGIEGADNLPKVEDYFKLEDHFNLEDEFSLQKMAAGFLADLV